VETVKVRLHLNRHRKVPKLMDSYIYNIQI